MAIELPRETERHLVASIQRYFREHMDEEIGDLKAALLLEFVLKEVGPSLYNRGVADAQAVLRQQVADLDVTCFEHPFGYWAP